MTSLMRSGRRRKLLKTLLKMGGAVDGPWKKFPLLILLECIQRRRRGRRRRRGEWKKCQSEEKKSLFVH